MTNVIEIIKVCGAVVVALFAIWKLTQPALWIWKQVKQNLSQDTAAKLDSIIQAQTEQSKQLEDIKDNQEFSKIVHQSILEQNKVMWWISDKEGKTIEVSPETCRVLKLPESSFLGSNWVNRVPMEQHEKLFQEWNNSIEFDRDYIFEYDLLDGENKYIHLKAHAKKAGLRWYGVLQVA